MSQLSDMVRTEFKKGDDIRDAGLTTPENVVRYDDILYGTDPKWQVMDVYRPKDAEGRVLPVIVSVHGGGWVYGDKERYQYYCMSLVQHGFAVVNFTYRLAPDFQYPAPLEDVNLVFGWIARNAAQYGLDTERVFGVGDSAGAHLLGLYASILTNPEYAAGFAFTAPDGVKLRAVGLNCGAYVMESDGPDGLTSGLMKDFMPEGGTAEELESITVTNHMTEHFPPVFLMTATGDFLIGQAHKMAQKLTEKQIPFEFHFYGDAEHSLGHVFHCNMKLEIAAVCNKEECEFFKKHC